MKKLGSVLGPVGLLVIAAMALGGCENVAGVMIGRTIAVNMSAPLPPVPADAQILKPTADVNAGLGAFSGAWQGQWGQGRKMHWFWTDDMLREKRAHLLVVEEITVPDRAKVVFSNGKSPAVLWYRMRDETWARTDAKFENGALVVEIAGARAVYRINSDGNTLAAELTEPGMPLLRATLRRVSLAELQKETNAK